MKITLIGASGFVGTRLIELLKQNNYFLQNVDKQQSRFHSEITVIANVLDKNNLVTLLDNTDVVILLAAEHRDDVTPTSLYYDVNVGGMRNTLEAMEANGVKRIIFTSSVAVYGLNKKNPTETYPADPFNHYGKSKWEAEKVLQEWYKVHPDWNINVIRPTVIFGERNRGNVYNLLKQISSGRFLMVGKGNNKKSMAYVGNIVTFIKFLIENKTAGYEVYNYIDKPDFTMNELVDHVSKVLNKHIPSIHYPLWLGMLGGYYFDVLAFITRRKLTISSVRVKKFCATTQFDATKVQNTDFRAPYTLAEGLARTLEFEFIHDASNGVTFISE
ncbi:NAD-dependent epimerase/dehydratase family protein [Bacteroides fragilis]|uniref:NAD-dependent epimerase/dehydratase family protein n=1 Tax=Bacteroides fragilis TaxID=817 RepID=UPI001CC9FCD9|nr:NAD-dependent epimerase/dehydratase family protein [Bacteroides fragilis]MCS2211994.1 NAD-dependent epimerase/dehydratase family protein [Bacteroides fragilis]MCS2254080.1 NAD-dependent epimerase/dehydratase family protein [Bacteroides fragilis]UBF16106.1 NAD-dependent epimerase/dehydratase family protein [Bacteroides fragilis]UVR86716.1 NAD-dependent epimerase/dehydratase family protein [Bacteroides fragilis]